MDESDKKQLFNSTTGLWSTLSYLSAQFFKLNRGDQQVEVPSNYTPAFRSARPTTANCFRGYKATYLGKVQATCNRVTGSASAQTFECIDRLLQGRCDDGQHLMNENECVDDMEVVYVDVRRCKSIVVYQVDARCCVTAVTQFDLARVAFCTGGVHPAHDGCLLAWLYRQETPAGFRLDCHVMKLSTRTKARRMAARIGDSFDEAYEDVRAAIEVGCQCQNFLTSGPRTTGNVEHCTTAVAGTEDSVTDTERTADSASDDHLGCCSSDDDVFVQSLEAYTK